MATYRTPRFKLGDVVFCDWRGEVKIVGVTDGPIPWPIGIRDSNRSLVIYQDLAKAIRLESVGTVSQLFGVARITVTKWRKALGVPHVNPGTLAKLRQNARSEAFKTAKMAMLRSGDPRRGQAIAAALRGKPSPMRGRPLSEIHREKVRQAHLASGHRPPCGRSWEPWEDEAIRTLPAKEAAEKTGRTISAIRNRRYETGMTKKQKRRQQTSEKR
jgi:hypothetical protein